MDQGGYHGYVWQKAATRRWYIRFVHMMMMNDYTYNDNDDLNRSVCDKTTS